MTKVPIISKQCGAFFEIPFESCSQCNRPIGLFKCHGCTKNFCEVHATEHRNALKKQLDNLRDLMRTWEPNADQEISRGKQVVIDQIKDWRQQSIAKINEVADEALRQLTRIAETVRESRMSHLTGCRQELTNRVKQAHENSDYHERHLEYWHQFYLDLRRNFEVKLEFAKLEYTTALITGIAAREYVSPIQFTKWCYFDRTCPPTVDIQRNGIVQHTNTRFVAIEPCSDVNRMSLDQVIELTQPAIQRFYDETGGELLTGDYRFHMMNGCRFLGVISHSMDTGRELLNQRSVYGWNGDNGVYLDGFSERGYRGYQSDMEAGDIVSMTVDYEQRTIGLRNLTKNSFHELAVDVEKCPPPWKLKVRFYE